jgi:hypothetical protein
LSHSESVSAVPILLFSRGNGRAFPIDSGRVATGAHVPRRREPLWYGEPCHVHAALWVCMATRGCRVLPRESQIHEKAFSGQD